MDGEKKDDICHIHSRFQSDDIKQNFFSRKDYALYLGEMFLFISPEVKNNNNNFQSDFFFRSRENILKSEMMSFIYIYETFS